MFSTSAGTIRVQNLLLAPPAGGRKIVRKSLLNYEFGGHFFHARTTTFAPTIIGVLVGM